MQRNHRKYIMGRQKSEHKKERNEALYMAYKRIRSERLDLPEEEVVRLAIHAPQPRMWVPFNSVYRILRRIIYKREGEERRDARKGLRDDIERCYENLRRLRMFSGKGRPAYFIASFIIAEPSHGFYISIASAVRIISEMRKEKQRLWRRK